MSSMHFKDLYSFNQNSFCSFTTHLFHQFRYLKLSKHYYVIGPDTLFAMSLKFYDNYLAFKCMKIYYAINYSKNHQNYFYLLGFLRSNQKWTLQLFRILLVAVQVLFLERQETSQGYYTSTQSSIEACKVVAWGTTNLSHILALYVLV